MGTFNRQLGRDVPVTPVPLAALPAWPGIVRSYRSSSTASIDLEAAFLVGVEAIIYAQRGKALLAFTVVLTPTGRPSTHTHVKGWGLRLGFSSAKWGRKEDKQTKITVGCNPTGRIMQSLQDQCKHINLVVR